jgi:hypothetical protein
MSGETKKLERNISRELGAWERNIEATINTTLADTARVLQGDFSNYGNSLQRTILSAGTGGLVSQEDLRKITGETGSEKYARLLKEHEEAQVAADIRAKEDERRQQIIRRIAAEIESRRMTPGTSLLTTAALSQQSPGNTILTSRG